MKQRLRMFGEVDVCGRLDHVHPVGESDTLRLRDRQRRKPRKTRVVPRCHGSFIMQRTDTQRDGRWFNTATKAMACPAQLPMSTAMDRGHRAGS